MSFSASWSTMRNAVFGDKAFNHETDQMRCEAANYSLQLGRLKEQVAQEYYSEESPIFLCGATWRCGSTLVQRWLSEDGRIIWGEPLNRCAIVQKMSRQLIGFNENWPKKQDFLSERSGDLSEQWIANISPTAGELVRAHHEFLTTLFGTSARQAGAIEWGLKEVRFGIEEIRYLRLLYPKAKIILLYRDLIPSYKSFHSYITGDFTVWPSQPVCSPWQFAKLWKQRCADFTVAEKEVDALCIKYEELISEVSVQNRVSEYLGVNLPDIKSLKKIAGRKDTSDNTHDRPWASQFDILLLRIFEKIIKSQTE